MSAFSPAKTSARVQTPDALPPSPATGGVIVGGVFRIRPPGYRSDMTYRPSASSSSCVAAALMATMFASRVALAAAATAAS